MCVLLLQLLSKAYTAVAANRNAAAATASTSAIAQQANFWDPPAKNEEQTVVRDSNLQELLK